MNRRTRKLFAKEFHLSIAFVSESLYLCPFGSASVSCYTNLQGHSRPSRFPACTRLEGSPLQIQTIIFQSGKF